MWVYKQSTGKLMLDDGMLVGIGYSGTIAMGKNNPSADDMPNIGPLPRGIYTIGLPHDTPLQGPFVLPLVPDPANTMHGRSGFLIHGDSREHPGAASEGCVILSREVREKLAASADKRFVVIA